MAQETSKNKVKDVTHLPFSYDPNAMTPEEIRVYELIVEQGRRIFVAVGLALAQLRDRGGAREFETFEEYVEQKWGLAVRRQVEHLLAKTEADVSHQGEK